MQGKVRIRQVASVTSLVVGALALFVSPAGAQTPPGNGLNESFTVTCDGETVNVVTPGLGRTGWADGQHLVLQSVTISGPEGTSMRTFGGKSGLGATLTCDETVGPYTYTYVAALVPPPNADR